MSISCFASPARAEAALRTEFVVAGFSYPIFAAAPPRDSTRLFVIEQYSGNVRIVDLAVPRLLPTPFLTVRGVSSAPEEGLLGLAFHPSYPDSPYFYVHLTDIAHSDIVRRYRVSNDPALADSSSGTTVLVEPSGCAYHHSGWIGFGPDGYLYVALGDGGCPDTNAQSDANRRGKILRLDVDGGAPYAVPPTNPFALAPWPKNEFWAKGLRNPWQCAFDRQTGDLFIADAGSTREEIDFEPSGSPGGRNYGWSEKEAFWTYHCATPCDSAAFTSPIFAYDHGQQPIPCVTVGGHVYRGADVPELSGRFLFGDYCEAQVWTLRVVAGVATEVRERTAELERDEGNLVTLSSIAEDARGEFYLLTRIEGAIRKIVPDTSLVAVDEPPAGRAPDLGPPRPNPGSGSIACGFALARAGHVVLRIHDARGAVVRTLVDGRRAAGPAEAIWDMRDDTGNRVRPGVYFWRLEAAGRSRTAKCAVLR